MVMSLIERFRTAADQGVQMVGKVAREIQAREHA